MWSSIAPGTFQMDILVFFFKTGLYPEGKILLGCKLTEIQVKKEIQSKEKAKVSEKLRKQDAIFLTL